MHPPVINGHSVDRFADLCVQIADLQAVLRVAVANPYGSCRPPIGDEHEATVCQKRWIDLAGEPRSRSASPRTTPARDETAPPGQGPENGFRTFG
jgi:hypothetical protein